MLPHLWENQLRTCRSIGLRLLAISAVHNKLKLITLRYTAQSTKDFPRRWGIQHTTGIPYNPTGQVIVEHAHHAFKTLPNKKKGETRKPLPEI